MVDLPIKRFRYRVTDVWGDMVGRLDVGMTIIDDDHGEEHEWTVWSDAARAIVGGWNGVFIDEVSEPEILEQLRQKENGRAFERNHGS